MASKSPSDIQRIMRTTAITCIVVYQKILSPDQGLPKKLGIVDPELRTCAFSPTCSEYTKRSIQLYGVRKGVWLGIKRLIRCHPWQKNHYDPVPGEIVRK